MAHLKKSCQKVVLDNLCKMSSPKEVVLGVVRPKPVVLGVVEVSLGLQDYPGPGMTPPSGWFNSRHEVSSAKVTLARQVSTASHIGTQNIPHSSDQLKIQ